MDRKQQYLLGVKAGIPVIMGFIPVAIAYAIMAGQSGLTVFQTILMSVMVFAGASQMMAVGMLAQGAGLITMILATFILNLRHLIMSTCVMNRLRYSQTGFNLLLAFGVTDESFAIFTTTEEEKSTDFFFWGLITVTYSSWVVGTIIGSFASQLLPPIISDSLGIALYAMFIGLLIPNVKNNLRLGAVVILAVIINVILVNFMTTSWAIILSTLIGAGIGVFMMDDPKAEIDIGYSE